MGIRCIVCDTEDQWRNVDEFRLKPMGMAMCECCGMVSYPEIIAKNEELKEYYREDYRRPPSIGNLFTGQRKLNFHGAFLGPVFDRWKKEGKTRPVVADVGAAYGMYLNWIRGFFPQAQLHGTELTLSYRRVAWHQFQIQLDEEFNDQPKYDLISSYKVAEHMPNADQELMRYFEALSADGQLYVSVPTWFNRMHNFGAEGWDIEYYYSKNHINVWTTEHWEYVLKKAGFKTVAEDHVIYDETYLCERDLENMDKVAPQPTWDPDARLEDMRRIKAANDLFCEAERDRTKFRKAIEIWPDFPIAHKHAYESERADWHKKGWEAIKRDVIGEAEKACPESAEIAMWSVDLHMRYKKYEEAMGILEDVINRMKPVNPGALMNLAQCFRQLAVQTGDPKQKVHFLGEARGIMRHLQKVSLQNQPDAINWIYHDEAQIPAPFESVVSEPKPILKE